MNEEVRELVEAFLQGNHDPIMDYFESEFLYFDETNTSHDGWDMWWGDDYLEHMEMDSAEAYIHIFYRDEPEYPNELLALFLDGRELHLIHSCPETDIMTALLHHSNNAMNILDDPCGRAR